MHDDDLHYLPVIERFHGPVSAERCRWALFWARVVGADPDVAVDVALVQLDRERHADD